MADAWGEAINAALAIYLKRQGDKAPKQYAVELTPEDKWKAEQQKDLYGSLSNYVGQYLAGSQQTPDFTFRSPIFAGEKFAGGMTMPKIDFSKMGGMLGKAAGGAPGATATGVHPPTAGAPGRGFANKDIHNEGYGNTIPQRNNYGAVNSGTVGGSLADPSMFSEPNLPEGVSYQPLSPEARQQIVSGVSKYGKAGAEIALALATANPALGVKGVIDLVKAIFAGNKGGTPVAPGPDPGKGPY